MYSIRVIGRAAIVARWGLPHPVALLLYGRSLMYLFYMDESGDPSAWEKQGNFILAGIAVHEGQIRRLSGELSAVQHGFFPDIRVPLEFHAQHIFSGKGRFRGMACQQRTDLLRAAYCVIANAGFPNLIAFISAIHVSAVASPFQALHDCLEDICERFNAFLVRQFRAGYPDKGLLIMDRSGRESRVRELMSGFVEQGTARGYLGNIVDVPYFADSKHTRMLQLVDLVAFAGGKYFNSNNDTLLQKILPRVDRRSSTGPSWG